MKLTDKERVALANLWESSKGNGHDFGFPDDMPNIVKASRGGLAASLSNKGLIDIHDNSYDKLPNQFIFTDAGKAMFADFNNSSALKGDETLPQELPMMTLGEFRAMTKDMPDKLKLVLAIRSETDGNFRRRYRSRKGGLRTDGPHGLSPTILVLYSEGLGGGASDHGT